MCLEVVVSYQQNRFAKVNKLLKSDCLCDQLIVRPTCGGL